MRKAMVKIKTVPEYFREYGYRQIQYYEYANKEKHTLIKKVRRNNVWNWVLYRENEPVHCDVNFKFLIEYEQSGKKKSEKVRQFLNKEIKMRRKNA